MAHVNPDRDEVCFFPSWPWTGRAGGELIRRIDPEARSCWEPACGIGSLAHGLGDYFERTEQSDKFAYGGHAIHDFLGEAPPPFGPVDWIVTNPPFGGMEARFVERALGLAGRGVAMLLRLAFLETVGREGLLYPGSGSGAGSAGKTSR